jgi:hypothetical protein
MPDLSPASQKLLRELAHRDKGTGVAVRYASRGRWYLDGPSSSDLFNTRTFPALYDAGLAVGWDEHDDDGPMRITEAGRKLAAELDAKTAAQEAAKKARPKPSADGATAMRLLREIAKHEEPVLVYDDGRRRVWRLGSHDGYSASIDTWTALAKADRIRIERAGSIGGQRVSVTDAGRRYVKGAA